MNSPSLPNEGVLEPKSLPETSWLQSAKELVGKFRERLLGEVKSEKAEAEPKEEVDRYKVLDPKKIIEIKMVCGRYAGEWLEDENIKTIHEELKKVGLESKIAEFIEKDPRIVEDLNDLGDKAAQHSIPESAVQSRRSVIINAYLGRFLKVQAGEQAEYRFGVGVGKNFGKNYSQAQIELPKEKVESVENKPNVISFEQAREAHSHHPTDPKPTEPVQPTPAPREPEDEDFKVA